MCASTKYSVVNRVQIPGALPRMWKRPMGEQLHHVIVNYCIVLLVSARTCTCTCICHLLKIVLLPSEERDEAKSLCCTSLLQYLTKAKANHSLVELNSPGKQEGGLELGQVCLCKTRSGRVQTWNVPLLYIYIPYCIIMLQAQEIGLGSPHQFLCRCM